MASSYLFRSGMGALQRSVGSIAASARLPQTVCVGDSTRSLVTGQQNCSSWKVSTPHPVSNLRQVLPSDTSARERTEELVSELQKNYKWHHDFWVQQNTDFNASKDAFEQQFRLKHNLGRILWEFSGQNRSAAQRLQPIMAQGEFFTDHATL
eukprot:m.1261305 g.1261305  ORF g.1261305 m.1261305 type:complete len:152 (-) comp24732_c0_seq1:5708-6163(-)